VSFSKLIHGKIKKLLPTMNELTASLILPHLDSDYHWLMLTTAVCKRLSSALDKDHHWEEHFGMLCKDLPRARFAVAVFVQCKHRCTRFNAAPRKHKTSVFDPSISERYKIVIHVDPAKCLARQVINCS
jgi:hypothetical protein